MSAAAEEILILEDGTVAVGMVVEYLTEEGFAVDHAAEGESRKQLEVNAPILSVWAEPRSEGRHDT